MKYIISAVALAALCLCSCTDSVPAQYVMRLDRTLAQYNALTPSQKDSVDIADRAEIEAMFSVMGYDDVGPATISRWSVSDAVRVFQPAVDSVYPTVTHIEKQLGHILHAAEIQELGLPHMRFATVTWGNPRPIVRVDTVMLIALNHFLGADYPGYAHWPEFRRTEKTPEQLPYSIAAALAATEHPMAEGENATLLSWMLYEGALIEARMRLVEGSKLHVALGYSKEQLDYVKKNSQAIWQEMAVKKVIYETDPSVIDRYIVSAPYTPLLGGTTPGRIGRYIGYLIVKSYLSRHKGTKVGQLLEPDFYLSPQSLIESGFNGR